MVTKCPVCNNTLNGKEVKCGDSCYYCTSCGECMEPEIFEEIRCCPDCGAELTVVVGCGVDDYYCEKCGKTVLKENLKTDYKKL